MTGWAGRVLRVSCVSAIVLSMLLVAGSAQAKVSPMELVGKKAPDVSGKGVVAGEQISLSSYLGKVPVVLTFWSIYCKSCTEEMVALQKLFERNGPSKLAVIAVNEDGDVGLTRVRTFLERFETSEDGAKLTIPLLFDEKGEVFNRYRVVSLPTLVYIGKDGMVQGVIEGFEKGREQAVANAISKLIGDVSPEVLKDAAAEAVYDLDAVVPVCGVYRDGAWYRPLDLDESKAEAMARAKVQGEDHLRREAIRLALLDIGVSLAGAPKSPACGAPYGNEIRTPVLPKDQLDIFIDKINLPRSVDVVSQETVERERDLLLFRRIKVNLQVLRDALSSDGYSVEKSVLRIRFVRAAGFEERIFMDAIRDTLPYVSELVRGQGTRGKKESVLTAHATAEKVVEKLREIRIGARNITVDLLPGEIVEVSVWR